MGHKDSILYRPLVLGTYECSLSGANYSGTLLVIRNHNRCDRSICFPALSSPGIGPSKRLYVKGVSAWLPFTRCSTRAPRTSPAPHTCSSAALSTQSATRALGSSTFSDPDSNMASSSGRLKLFRGRDSRSAGSGKNSNPQPHNLSALRLPSAILVDTT